MKGWQGELVAESKAFFRVGAAYQGLMREVGLDADAVFDHPDIRVWRSIPERENCVLDAQRADGSKIRLHIKRHRSGGAGPAEAEAQGIGLLEQNRIATTPLVGWGALADGRSFVITQDLAGFRDAEKLVKEGGVALEKLIDPTARIAAKLHAARLHHRDLYLCHFFARPAGDGVELRLIDAARVKHLPGWPFRRRWVIKDLGQFWYSLEQAGATAEQKKRWLEVYEKAGGGGNLRGAIERKARWIDRHDAKLREKQPGRNVSIDGK